MPELGRRIDYPPEKVRSKHEGMALAAQEGSHCAADRTDGCGITSDLQNQWKWVVNRDLLNLV